MLDTGGFLMCIIAGSFVGYLAGAYLADRVGRRLNFAVFAVGLARVVRLFLIAPITHGVMLMFGFPLSFFASGTFSGMGALLTEFYPSRIRGSGQGFATISAAESVLYSRLWLAI